MPGKQAKVVTPPMLRRMLRRVVEVAPFHARDRAMILLSVKAGLRACEIAGSIGRWFSTRRATSPARSRVHDAIAKKRGGRRIPMHPDLRRALQRLARTERAVRTGHPLRPRRPFAANERGQLVCGAVQRTRIRRVLVAFRPAHVHHRRRSQCPPLGLQPARRAAARWAPIHRDDRALHRRRHPRAEAAGRVPLGAGRPVGGMLGGRRAPFRPIHSI